MPFNVHDGGNHKETNDGGGTSVGDYLKTGGASLLTLVGGLGAFGSTRKTRGSSDFDYDPQRRALTRFNELSNMDSPYWQTLMKKYNHLFSSAQPTIDTLTGFNKSAGISDAGATNIAYQQSKAQVARTQEKVGDAVTNQFLNSENLAQGYLQLESDRAKTQNENYESYLSNQNASEGDFFSNLLTGGVSLLSKFV